MRKIFLFYILLQCAGPAFGQWASIKISGQVIDDKQQPLAYANVMLIQAADSSLVKGELTDEAGRFTLELPGQGTFRLEVAMLGFTSHFSAPFEAGDASKTLPPIQLEVAANTLDAVTVKAQRPFIERQLDKLVVNVENSIVSTGASILEVLERSPGVLVDQDGNISLQGKQGVVVMIDGKPSHLSATDLSNMLKGMASSTVDRIEIITNPSARYDAAGNAGIINIRMKKDQRLGLNGNASLSYGQGRYEKINTGLNLNYRTRHFNLFGNYSFARRTGFNNLRLYRKFSTDGELQGVFDQNNYIVFPFNTHTARAGADWTPGKKTTIGILVNGISNRFDPRGENETFQLNGNEQKIGRFTTQNRSEDHWYNYAFNANLKHDFDSLGRQLTVDIDYARYWNVTDQLFTTLFYDLSENPIDENILVGDLDGLLQIRSAKADYSHLMGNAGNFEAGLKTSYVTNDSDMKFYNRIQGEDQYDPGRSNHFIYKETIRAAYLNYNKEQGGWGLQAGLRLEQTIADGHQLITDEKFKREYTQLFPSMVISKHLNEKHDLSISLSRRIDRPNYQQLNPFRFFLDPTTYREGNPFLQPQLTYSAELNHTFLQRITTTLSYSHTKDNMVSVLLQNDADRVTVQTDSNIEGYDYFGLGFSIPWQPVSWWNSHTSLQGYYDRYIGTVAGANLRNGRATFYGNTSHTFTLPHQFKAELNIFYQHYQAYGISIIEPISSITVGLQKEFLQGKGQLRATVSDLTWRQYPRGSTQFANIDEVFTSRRDTRIATLAFTYRFGSGTVAPARRRGTGADQEKDRVQMGNG